MINFVYAEELPEITNDIEIRYKWYKEVIGEGEYYPLKDIKEEDIYDENNIKYVGATNVYDDEYCSLPSEFYQLKEKKFKRYTRIYNASYVLIENINYDNNIKIYYGNKLIDFKVISNENNQVKINLKKEYLCDKLLFFVDTNDKYTISLYRDLNFQKQIIAKEIENQKISIPDGTWITENTQFFTDITEREYENTALTKLISETTNCSYQEKYVYKYEIIKEYYDDNYHLNVDGYIKDINEYKIYYKGEPIVNTIEIIQEKIVEVPKTEYVYIENEIKENDSSQQTECPTETITETVIETKTEFVEKEVFKFPKQVYVIILILLIVIVLLIIKLYRKYVE